MKRFIGLLLTLALLLAPVARAQSINPQIGGGISFGFDGGISHTGGALTGGISFASGYPIDQVTGVTITGAYGVGALTAAWKTGPLFDLVVSGVTTTIHGVGPGYPDVKAIITATGGCPTGLCGGTISKWYDQSGSANDFVQPSLSAGLQPELWLINGKVSIGAPGFLNGSISGGAPSFMTSTIPVNNRSLSLFTAMTPMNTRNGLGTSVPFSTGTLGGAVATDMGLSNAFIAGSQVYAGPGDATSGLVQAIGPYIGTQPQILGLVASSIDAQISQNSTTGSSGAPLVIGTHTAAILGNFANGTFPASTRMQALIASSSIFSGGQVTTMQTVLAAWSIISLTTNKANKLNVVIDGASTDYGQGSDPTGGYGVIGGGGYSYGEMLKDQLGAGISWHNFAAGSATIEQRTPDYTGGLVQNAGFQSGSTKNILLAPGITVFDSLGVESAATAFAAFQTWLTAAQSVGWTKIAVIAYPDTAITGMAAYNALLFANTSLGYDIIDGRSVLLPLVAPYGNAYTNLDSHPTVLGSALYVQLLKPYLQQFNFLMRRDIGGPANDNRPVGIDVAA